MRSLAPFAALAILAPVLVLAGCGAPTPMEICDRAFKDALKQVKAQSRDQRRAHLRKVVETCKIPARQDQVLAQQHVAVLLDLLLGDFKAAEPWYLKAAYNGSVRAQHRLGYAYTIYSGHRNRVEAYAWYRTALHFGLKRQNVTGNTIDWLLIVESMAYEMAESEALRRAVKLAKSRIRKIEFTIAKRRAARAAR